VQNHGIHLVPVIGTDIETLLCNSFAISFLIMSKSRLSNKKALATQLFQKLVALSRKQDSGDAITLFTYRPSEEIYKIGKNSRGVFYIATGLIKLVRPQETGDEPLVRLSSDREFLGILSLVRGYQYTSTAIAVNQVEAFRISRDFFTRALDSDYELGYLFIRYLLEIIYSAETKISDLITKTVEERIAATLLSLSFQEEGVKKVTVPKKDLAMISGSIQETISRKLAAMAKNGLIRLKGKEIIITNLEALLRLSKITN
jgi:CRP/FNR family transcriptional regulator